MALPPLRNIDIYRGDGYEHTLTVVDGSHAVDLTTYLPITGQIRQSHDANDAVDFAVDDSGAADGVIVFSLTGAETTDLPTGNNVYDFEAVSPTTGEPLTIQRGKATVHKDVTHA